MEREREREHARTLSIPHSVSQSVSMRDYYINEKKIKMLVPQVEGKETYTYGILRSFQIFLWMYDDVLNNHILLNKFGHIFL